MLRQVPEPAPPPATPLAQLAGVVPSGGSGSQPSTEHAAEHSPASAAERQRERDERELLRKARNGTNMSVIMYNWNCLMNPYNCLGR